MGAYQAYRVTKDSPNWMHKAYNYVRTDAFVFGQDIPINIEYSTEDDPDEEALILVEDGKPIAGCRISVPIKDYGRIARVCVIRAKQRSGVGHILIAEAEKWLQEEYGVKHIFIVSQDRAEGFYERCGYKLIEGADPDDYEHPNDTPEEKAARKKRAEEETHHIDLGFSCVVVDKYL